MTAKCPLSCLKEVFHERIRLTGQWLGKDRRLLRLRAILGRLSWFPALISVGPVCIVQLSERGFPLLHN
jgi:hypothetical protein